MNRIIIQTFLKRGRRSSALFALQESAKIITTTGRKNEQEVSMDSCFGLFIRIMSAVLFRRFGGRRRRFKRCMHSRRQQMHRCKRCSNLRKWRIVPRKMRQRLCRRRMLGTPEMRRNRQCMQRRNDAFDMRRRLGHHERARMPRRLRRQRLRLGRVFCIR